MQQPITLAPTKKTLSVGEVAQRSGVAVSALHFYEAEGLIQCWRSQAGHRRYGRDVLRRIAVIRIAQSAGLSLKEVAAAFATLPESRTPNAKDWALLSARWHDMLSARIEQLTSLRDNLVGCIGCGCLSVDDCPLRNPGDVLGAERNAAPAPQAPFL